VLYALFYPLREIWFGFNVFRYITFRAMMASITAFLLTLLIGPVVVRWLTSLKVGQKIRQKSEVGKLYDLHSHKAGTPTMGGLLILFALLGSTFLWADVSNPYVLMAAAVTGFMGLVGFLDDWAKIRQKSARGLSVRSRLMWQSLIALAFGLALFWDRSFPDWLEVPFFKNPVAGMGIWMVPFIVFVLVGTSNAVNLADGLDGLAIGSTAMIALCLTLMCYLTGHRILADYLYISHIPDSGELTVFCAALVGASMGFLWYNSQPAAVFMGDTGSLALGGAIGAVSVLIKKELLLVLLGGIFVAEALSVIVQVASFRMTGRRVFLMAPIHHHFQMKGWAESKVTIRFWILGAILALMSLGTLKLR